GAAHRRRGAAAQRGAHPRGAGRDGAALPRGHRASPGAGAAARGVRAAPRHLAGKLRRAAVSGDPGVSQGVGRVSREEDRAKRAAELVDALVDGRAPEPRDAAERALAEAAQLLRPSGPSLDPARRDALVAGAFAAAGAPRPAPPVARRPWPWVVAAATLAAALILAVRARPAPRLRSPDEIVGRIAPADAADASRRIDLLYADRLAAYRGGPGRGACSLPARPSPARRGA